MIVLPFSLSFLVKNIDKITNPELSNKYFWIIFFFSGGAEIIVFFLIKGIKNKNEK